MTPTTRKTQTTASSASVDVAQKPVGTIKPKQPLSGRDALAALQTAKDKAKAPAKGWTPSEITIKSAKKAAKAVSANKTRRVKGVAPSRTPEARIARRNMRNMLKALTIAADESQDVEVREYAEQRAAALAEKLGIKQ